MALTLAIATAGAAWVPHASAAPDPLPAGYAYEMVSPVRTQGQDFTGVSVSSNEDAIIGKSAGGIGDIENLPDSGIQYYTSRTAEGWITSAIAPPASAYPGIGQGLIDSTDDLQTTLWRVNLREDKSTDRFTPLLRKKDGTFSVAGPTFDDTGKAGPSTPVAASADLSTLVVDTRVRDIVNDGTTQKRLASRNDLVIVRPDGTGSFDMSQVAYRAGATMALTCAVRLGGERADRGAVSSDANQVIFAFTGLPSCLAPANQRVWAKIGTNDPVDLSAPQCVTTTCGSPLAAAFEGASRDGSRVYFTTEQKLLDGDQDTLLKRDLYEYDHTATGVKLRSATASAAPEGAGVVGVSTTSEDGAYVSFVAKGRPLTSQANARGLTPQEGDNNLYVYHRKQGDASGTFSFVGPVTSADADPDTQYTLVSASSRTAFSSTDGRFLVFTSVANLTGDRLAGDTYPDLYRYDAMTDELLRIWTDDPAHNGHARSDGPDVGARARGTTQSSWGGVTPVSDDGKTIAFTTAERLSPGDVNDADDAYMWQESTDRLTMISDGLSQFPVKGTSVSKSGNMVLFNGMAPLTASHTSGARALFAVRKGGGFPEPPLPPEPCVPGRNCQQSIPEAPPVPSLTGSLTFFGSGNVLVAPPKAASSIRVSKIKAVRGTSTRAKVRVSGKGKLQVSGRNVVRRSEAVREASTVRVLVKLTRRGKHKLGRDGRVKTQVNVRFIPENGKSVRKRVSVTFKVKSKRRKAEASSRSARTPKVQSSDVRKGR